MYNKPTTRTEIPTAIGAIAERLHSQSINSISCVLAPNELSACDTHTDMWTIEAEKISFANLEARNQCAAAYVFADKIDNSDCASDREIFTVALQLYQQEIGHEDSAAGRFLALANENINILGLAADIINSDEMAVFSVLRLVGLALPFLQHIEKESLCTLIEAQNPKTEGDLAAGLIFRAIEDALATRTKLAWDIYHHAIENITDSTRRLVTSTMLALANSGQEHAAINRVLLDAHSSEALIVQSAIFSIALILDANKIDNKYHRKCYETLRKKSKSHIAEIKNLSIHAMGIASKKHREMRADLVSIAKSGDRHALHVMSVFISAIIDETDILDIYTDILDALSNATLETNCAHEIDHIFSKIICNYNQTDASINSIESFIVRNSSGATSDASTIDNLNQTIMCISKDKKLLSRLIARWLTSDVPQLTQACHSLIKYLWLHGVRSVKFDPHTIDDMDNHTLLLLARRMLGFIYHEEPLLTLTLSLLETKNAPERTYPLVRDLLINYIGIDYTHETLQAIENLTKANDVILTKELTSIRDVIATYQKNIDDLPDLQELNSPIKLRRAIALNKEANLRAIQDSAGEQSVLLKLIKRIPVKAGVGWFSVENDRIGETNNFQTISHSIAIPKRSIIDPVGYSIEGILFRSSKRGD
ncbi:hypothetical protein [Nitratidesulfovibrio sp.]|uniref:hypothetical protein n=1 Tax=Nitratidesulfovibrio sp. TaxID=2802297 RepID=UPI0033418CD7